MQGENQRVAELLKQQGKNEVLESKQGFLSELFGGNKSQQNRMPQSNNQSDQQNQGNIQQQGFNPVDLSDEDIAQATAIDPNLGRSLQHAKDIALRDKRSEEKYNLQKERQSPEHQRQQHIELHKLRRLPFFLKIIFFFAIAYYPLTQPL